MASFFLKLKNLIFNLISKRKTLLNNALCIRKQQLQQKTCPEFQNDKYCILNNIIIYFLPALFLQILKNNVEIIKYINITI